jgi:hypothetical protein
MKPLTAATDFWVAGIHRVDACLARKNDRVPGATQRNLKKLGQVCVVRCGSFTVTAFAKRTACPCTTAWLAVTELVGSFQELTRVIEMLPAIKVLALIVVGAHDTPFRPPPTPWRRRFHPRKTS